MRPGLAMSQDGLNWARIEGDHHTGALLDVGDEGQWDALFIGSPQAGFLFPPCPSNTYFAEGTHLLVGSLALLP